MNPYLSLLIFYDWNISLVPQCAKLCAWVLILKPQHTNLTLPANPHAWILSLLFSLPIHVYLDCEPSSTTWSPSYYIPGSWIMSLASQPVNLYVKGDLSLGTISSF